jgi:hypothetical protein
MGSKFGLQIYADFASLGPIQLAFLLSDPRN